jgi:hypothetical protein
MFGDISVWTWMGATIMFAMGGAAGYFIARQLKDKRTLELEEKLEDTRNELSQYRGDVNQHFLKTSLLLGKLTNDYREVYEHLATGAQRLCNNKPGTPELDLPDTRILPTTETPDEEKPALEQVASTTDETPTDINEPVETAAESREQEIADSQADVVSEETAAEQQSDSTKQEDVNQQAQKPAPEEVPARDETDEDEVPLGAESTPSVDTELHKTHPSIH